MRDAPPNKKISAASQKNDEKTTKNKQKYDPSVTSHQVHNLPHLPSSELINPHDDVTLPRLIEALQNRHRIGQMMFDEYSKTADKVKSILQEMDSNLISKDNLIHENNGKLVDKDKNIQSNKEEIEHLEKKTKMQEHKIDILEKTSKIYEDDKCLLEQELETREQRLQKELSDTRHIEQRLHSMVTDTQLKWERECERRINEIQSEMENKLFVKDEKLRQLKAIVMESKTFGHPDPLPCQMQSSQLSGEEGIPEKRSGFPSPLSCPIDSPHLVSEPDSPTSVEEVDSNPRPTCRLPHTSSPLSVTGCISAWEQHAAHDSRQDYVSLGTPTRAHTPGGSTVRQARRRAGCWTKEKNEANPPPLDLIERNYKRETPVRPLHRRSRCADREKWVDHKPSSSMDLGTVLQPVIPDAIQVSAPSEKVLSKCDRYMLTHQEVASDGEIQTKLIKGEVIKTRGGGKAVQFTDIETLKRELTIIPSFKRKYSKNKPADEDKTDGGGTDVETKCSVAMDMKAGSSMSPGYEHQWITKRRKP